MFGNILVISGGGPTLEYVSSILAVVDVGGALPVRAPLPAKFFSISCSFQRKKLNFIPAPPTPRVGTPPVKILDPPLFLSLKCKNLMSVQKQWLLRNNVLTVPWIVIGKPCTIYCFRYSPAAASTDVQSSVNSFEEIFWNEYVTIFSIIFHHRIH